jgi:hypothetical protein
MHARTERSRNRPDLHVRLRVTIRRRRRVHRNLREQIAQPHDQGFSIVSHAGGNRRDVGLDRRHDAPMR